MCAVIERAQEANRTKIHKVQPALTFRISTSTKPRKTLEKSHFPGERCSRT